MSKQACPRFNQIEKSTETTNLFDSKNNGTVAYLFPCLFNLVASAMHHSVDFLNYSVRVISPSAYVTTEPKFLIWFRSGFRVPNSEGQQKIQLFAYISFLLNYGERSGKDLDCSIGNQWWVKWGQNQHIEWVIKQSDFQFENLTPSISNNVTDIRTKRFSEYFPVIKYSSIIETFLVNR